MLVFLWPDEDLGLWQMCFFYSHARVCWCSNSYTEISHFKVLKCNGTSTDYIVPHLIKHSVWTQLRKASCSCESLLVGPCGEVDVCARTNIVARVCWSQAWRPRAQIWSVPAQEEKSHDSSDRQSNTDDMMFSCRTSRLYSTPCCFCCSAPRHPLQTSWPAQAELLDWPEDGADLLSE